jgi:hypothetical protein
MSLTPDALTANAEVEDRLGETFDLEFDIDPEEPLWFSVDGVEAIRQFAGDGSGGVFAQLAGTRVLYVSSEGAAGILAADLDEFIKLLVACPYWQDILKFSAGGNLDEMCRAAAFFEAARADDEELQEARALLKSQLGLTEPSDPVGALHRAVSSEVIVRGPHGPPFVSLFYHSHILDEEGMRRRFPWLYG